MSNKITNAAISRNFNLLWPKIRKIIQQSNPLEVVIVLDIDATVLYNEPLSVCRADPNFKIQRVYDLAQRLNIPIYFVTARIGTKENRKRTEDQLKCMGFDYYSGLSMRGRQYRTAEEISVFKKNARQAIMSMTKNAKKKILLNCGDQWGDLLNAPGEDLYKLTSMYEGSYVLFRPLPEFHNDAEWALKLHETRN